MEEQEIKPGLGQKLKSGGKEYLRVLKITSKPSRSEFKNIFKITGIGILIIGFIGFVIQMIYQVLI
jgi:protein transport protein SEC61 subunit gamma-like protein